MLPRSLMFYFVSLLLWYTPRPKSNLGKKGFHFTQYSPSRKKSKAGTEGRSLSKDHGRMLLSGLLPSHFQSSFLYSPGPYSLEMVLSTVDWDLLYQLYSRKCNSHVHRPIWQRQSFNWGSLFLDVSSGWPRLDIIPH